MWEAPVVGAAWSAWGWVAPTSKSVVVVLFPDPGSLKDGLFIGYSVIDNNCAWRGKRILRKFEWSVARRTPSTRHHYKLQANCCSCMQNGPELFWTPECAWQRLCTSQALAHHTHNQHNQESYGGLPHRQMSSVPHVVRYAPSKAIGKQ